MTDCPRGVDDEIFILVLVSSNYESGIVSLLCIFWLLDWYAQSSAKYVVIWRYVFVFKNSKAFVVGGHLFLHSWPTYWF